MFADDYGLSWREKDILKVLLLTGDPTQIASRLFISRSTVKTHLSNLYEKCQVSSMPQLMAKYIREVIRGEQEREIK